MRRGGNTGKLEEQRRGGETDTEGKGGMTGLPAVNFGDLDCKVSSKD